MRQRSHSWASHGRVGSGDIFWGRMTLLPVTKVDSCVWQSCRGGLAVRGFLLCNGRDNRGRQTTLLGCPREDGRSTVGVQRSSEELWGGFCPYPLCVLMGLVRQERNKPVSAFRGRRGSWVRRHLGPTLVGQSFITTGR